MIALSVLLVLAAPAKGGTLSVHSMTGGARVLVDGNPAGTVPLVLHNLSAGKHHVRVQRLGYLAQDEDVVITVGKTAEIEADLLPTAGVVKVTSPTKGAQVFVDGKPAGGVPYEGEVSVGKRVIEIRKDGFAGYKQVLQVGAGNDYNVSATLKKGTNAPAATSNEIPLVAVAPRRSKPAPASGELALEAPPPAGPKTPLGVQPPPMQTEAVSTGTPVYQKWWFWTAAGVVVAGVVTGVVIYEVTKTPATCFANGGPACQFSVQLKDPGPQAR